MRIVNTRPLDPLYRTPLAQSIAARVIWDKSFVGEVRKLTIWAARAAVSICKRHDRWPMIIADTQGVRIVWPTFGSIGVRYDGTSLDYDPDQSLPGGLMTSILLVDNNTTEDYVAAFVEEALSHMLDGSAP